MVYKERGKWREQILIGGKRISSPYFASKFDAIEWKSKIKSDPVSRQILLNRGSCPTLCQFIPKHRCSYPNATEESTRIKWEQMERCHILPAFGHLPIDSITTPDVNRWIANLKEKLAPNSIKNVKGHLSLLLDTAINLGIIFSNPVTAAWSVKIPSRLPTFWTKSDADQFLIYCARQDWELFQLIAFAINTGLRPGELWALKGDCLNFDHGFVEVRRTFCTKTNLVKPYTKTKEARRVELPKKIWQLMLNKRSLQTTDLVFQFSMRDLSFRRFQPMARKASVKPIRMHDCRHTFASHLYMATHDLVLVQEALGHKKIDSTRVYTHITKDYAKGFADKLTADCEWVRMLDTKVVPIGG